MNKIWNVIKIIFIILFCLIFLGLLAGYIFLKNFDIRKYKPQIITAANQALGRQVNFDDIDLRVSLQNGIRFNLKNLTVSENPAFGTGDFAKVQELSVGLIFYLSSTPVRFRCRASLFSRPRLRLCVMPRGS